MYFKRKISPLKIIITVAGVKFCGITSLPEGTTWLTSTHLGCRIIRVLTWKSQILKRLSVWDKKFVIQVISKLSKWYPSCLISTHLGCRIIRVLTWKSQILKRLSVSDKKIVILVISKLSKWYPTWLTSTHLGCRIIRVLTWKCLSENKQIVNTYLEN